MILAALAKEGNDDLISLAFESLSELEKGSKRNNYPAASPVRSPPFPEIVHVVSVDISELGDPSKELNHGPPFSR